ncbi:potassium channel family protein [Nocardioides pacificus]
MGSRLPRSLSWLVGGRSRREHVEAAEPQIPDLVIERGTAGILLVLRRMRAPLIVLIVIFAVSVLGLSLIPGTDGEGESHRLTLFDAFYFMSYTATTIGFGELPHPFTPAQRMWVIVSIFMSVIGWAYAIGSMLTLVRDRAFRRAIARRLFERKVRHLGSPYVLLIGYGEMGRRIARSVDDMGRRFVVIERDEDRAASIDLDAYQADVPVLVGDARETDNLILAGLGSADCEAVLALSERDDVNLDVAMTTALIRPGLPVIAQASTLEIADRMRAFGAPEVVNPLERFGNHLRILQRSPAAYQLMMWLTSAPGTPIPKRRPPLPRGRWVVCGFDTFGREITADLHREGLEVTVVEGEHVEGGADRFAPEDLEAADLPNAVAFVAATHNDMTNLWLMEVARQANPDMVLVARHNEPGNAALFEALGLDYAMVRAEVVAHEVLARLANPSLMRFLPRVPHLGEAWAAEMVDRLVERCGEASPHIWRLALTAEEAPALAPWLQTGRLRLGDLVRSPHGRDRPVDAVVLALLRDDTVTPAPADAEILRPGDRLLVAGRLGARHALLTTLVQETTAAYVIDDRVIPASWLWRRLARTAGPPQGG